MPVIDRIGAWRALFYANDHTPMHVHMILKGENRGAKIWLENISLAKNQMLRPHEIKEALRIVESNKDKYKEIWHGFFGD